MLDVTKRNEGMFDGNMIQLYGKHKDFLLGHVYVHKSSPILRQGASGTGRTQC